MQYLSLHNNGPNCSTVGIGNVTVLFSYGVPVAAYVPYEGFYRTTEKYSTTTTRHIKAWMHDRPFCPVDPAFFLDGSILQDEQRQRVRVNHELNIAAVKAQL